MTNKIRCDKIRYASTNENSPTLTFRKALIQGQAPDKGLYIPNIFPKIYAEYILSMKDMTYPEIAFAVTNHFLKDEIPENELKRIVNEAYNYPIPLEKVTDSIFIMRLDQGPTASFKDFAARMMARLMQYYLKQENKNLLILTATSGDTGGAVADAFYGMDNINVIILFPEKEISDRQRKQMTTLGGNITTVAVEGKFDDCQSLVKQAFSDPELKHLNLSSANSINIGRLLPQTVYYFYAYSKLAKLAGEEVIFSIPSGNFGNLIGGILAKEMGLPICKFIVAVNENNEFPKFLKTGIYNPISPSIVCPSTAMNVGHPSNLARLIYVYNGQIDEKGRISRMPDMKKLRNDIFSVSISNSATMKTIKQTYEEYKIILEPHGAVGFAALQHYLSKTKDKNLIILLETANPAKFPDVINELLNFEPVLPESMKDIENKKEKFEYLPNKYQAFKEFLQNFC